MFRIRYGSSVMRHVLARISIGIAVLILPLGAQNGTDIPSIRVHGESLVSVAPDEAEMDVGIVSEAASTEQASAKNVAQVNRVVESLRSLLPASDIKSINVSINPNFRYPKEGAPVVEGYTASNTVRVTVRDVKMVRKVINAATKAGASSVNRLNFTLRNESEREARARALGEAADQAAAGAAALASSLKLRLGRVLHVEEGQPLVVSPAPQIDLGKAQSTDMTPISPGYIQIHANVNVEYEIIAPARW